MAQDVLISYVHNEKGRVDEEFENVESFHCLNNTNGEGNSLIVHHPGGPPNSTRDNIDHLIGSELQ